MRNLGHIIFYVKTKISIDFHICISAPLKQNIFAGKNAIVSKRHEFHFETTRGASTAQSSIYDGVFICENS